MLILRHCQQSSDDLIVCERIMLRFLSGKFKPANDYFNVWDHTLPEIYGIILAMFVKLDLVKCLNITEGELLDFIIDVDRGYLATYYHSFFHAADVTAVLYHILLDMNASQYLSKPDMAALLLAGLCHDIGHPGLNNLFQVNAKTELVQQHGETSVLEKYSCSLAMDLVDKHKLFRNIASSPAGILPEGNYATEQSMKESMVKAIMATDMSFHYDMLNNLNSLIEFTSTPSSSPSSSDAENESDSDQESTPSSPTSITASCSLSAPSSTTTTTTNEALKARPDSAVCHHSHSHCHTSTANHRRQSSASSTSSDCSDVSVASDASSQTSRSITGTSYRSATDLTPELRQNLCNCLLHAADISNAVKPWTLCKRWSDLVVQEFFRQGDIEKAQNLPISPNMDRDQYNQPQISLGFVDFVVQPYFESFVEFLPEASPFLVALTNNRMQWVLLQKAAAEADKEHVPVGTAESGADSNGDTDTHAQVDSDTVAGPAAEIKDLQRVNSPLPAHLTSGRRVSVAAGVLVLDETRPLRPPPRRMRHSTNTEASQSHILRKMKRSHSGRALSSCLRDLHVHHPRSIQSVGKTIVSQEAIVSALKREVALAGKESNVNLTSVSTGTTPGESPTSHAEALPVPPSDLDLDSATKLSNMIGTSLPKHSENTSPQPPSPQPAQYRRRRHGSLQIGTKYPSIRQEYGDGYIIFDDGDHSFGRMWDRRDPDGQHHDHGLECGNAEHIPSAIHSAFPNSRHARLPPYSRPHPHHPFTASTTPQVTASNTTFKTAAATVAPQMVEPIVTPEQATRFQPGESLAPASAAAPSLASNLANSTNVRSSTPAAMSGQIQYDWSRPHSTPALPQGRNDSGYGPLDHVIDYHESLAPTAVTASGPILTAKALSPLSSIQTAVMSAAAVPSAAAGTSATSSSSPDSKSDTAADKAAALPAEDFGVMMTESADGPMGCVVGQTVNLPMDSATTTTTMATKPSVVSGVDASDGAVSLSAASSSSAGLSPLATTATTTSL